MTLLQRNIEIKARCADLAAARAASLSIGATPAGVLVQTDTYFQVARGRLKLRQIEGQPSELIFYDRPNTAAAKCSDYWLVRCPDATELRALLTAAHGIRAVVRKQRELLLWQNVRIHLDRVENLGDFLELEAVLDTPNIEGISRKRLDELIRALRIAPRDHLPGSYVDMIQPAEPFSG